MLNNRQIPDYKELNNNNLIHVYIGFIPGSLYMKFLSCTPLCFCCPKKLYSK